ncbi:hypothetical protein BCR44DRAFT_1159129 [Catenaria anguillulae PL171]|uniref:Uncharacterized protein n=1 Tax=Catenaria anguillulae PL171 TaxID=765915 RepID=A0A1Y2H3Q9_9FUNG|nr:hypothetical protein BCR44DRAFT_1159129 [Catenaria anguillulae PL171]
MGSTLALTNGPSGLAPPNPPAQCHSRVRLAMSHPVPAHILPHLSGHVPDSLQGASFGWIKACAQAFIRSQHNHNAGCNEDGPPLFFNYSRPIPNSPTATTQVIKVWIAQHSSVPELNRFLQLVKPKQAVSTTAATSRDWVIFGEWIARQPDAIECPSRFLGSTRKGIRFSDLRRMMEGRRKSSGSSSVVEVEKENVDPFELALVLSDNEEESASELLSQESSQQSNHAGLPSALQDTLDIGEWIEQQQQQQQRRRRHLTWPIDPRCQGTPSPCLLCRRRTMGQREVTSSRLCRFPRHRRRIVDSSKSNWWMTVQPMRGSIRCSRPK